MLKSTNIKVFIKKWYESITKNHFETIMSSNLEYFLKHGKSFLPDVSFAQYFEEFKDYCTKTDNNALEKAYKMVKNLTTLRGRVQARAKSKALTKVDAQAKLKADDKERAEAQAKAEARSTDAKVEAKWDEDYDKKAQEDGVQQGDAMGDAATGAPVDNRSTAADGASAGADSGSQRTSMTAPGRSRQPHGVARKPRLFSDL